VIINAAMVLNRSYKEVVYAYIKKLFTQKRNKGAV
jgi:hypothetical protein